MNGKGGRYLTASQSQSSGSSGSHSLKTEVRTKTEMQRFINRPNDRENVHLHVDSKKQKTRQKLWFPDRQSENEMISGSEVVFHPSSDRKKR
jgi:hypothetical protein